MCYITALLPKHRDFRCKALAVQESEQNSFSVRPSRNPWFSFYFCLRNMVSTTLSSYLQVRWHSWYQTAKHANERRETNMTQELNDFKCLFPRKMRNLSSHIGLALAELTAPSAFNPSGWCATARTRKVVHLCVMEFFKKKGFSVSVGKGKSTSPGKVSTLHGAAATLLSPDTMVSVFKEDIEACPGSFPWVTLQHRPRVFTAETAVIHKFLMPRPQENNCLFSGAVPQYFVGKLHVRQRKEWF